MTVTEEAINELTGQAWVIRHSDPLVAQEMAEEALRRSLAQGYLQGEADSLRVLVHARLHQGALAEALTHALRGHVVYTELAHTEGVAYLCYLLGVVYWRMGHLDTALRYTLDGLEPARQAQEPNHQAALRNVLGGIHFEMGQYEEAVHYARQVLDLAEAEDLPFFQAEGLNNLAYTLHRTGRYEDALPYVRRALDMHSDRHSVASLLATLHTAGMLYMDLGEYETAHNHLAQGLGIAQEEQVQISIAEFTLALGRLAQRQGALADAQAWMEQTLTIAEQIQSPLYQNQIHAALTELYAQKGDFEQALHHHRRFHDFDKQVFNQQSDQRLQALRVEYDLEIARKEAEIYRIETEKLAAEIERRQAIEVQLQETNRRDFLVDTYNRRYFFDRAEEEMQKAATQPMAFFLIDLDHFKEINDTFGYLAADQVLRAAVDEMKSLLGPGDLLARYGGDEFVLMSVDTSVEGCCRLGEAIARHIAACPFLPNRAVTASIGATLYTPGDAPLPLEVVLDQADQALYAVKRRGRNGFQLWQGTRDLTNAES